eukprot:37121_1
MEKDCSTSSIINRNVTIGYAVVYCLVFTIVSAYSYYFLMKYNVKFGEKSCMRKLQMWLKDCWKRKRCYVPILTHLFDQITDISVAIQFYELAMTKYYNDWYECGGLNIWYLFIITIGSMIIYRIISALLIYQNSNKSIKRVFSQLADLELFRALYINYLCDKIEPSDPQRWITSMEASLESIPQALVQSIYLVKTETFWSSPLIVISLVSSIWSIISKLISDDKVIVIQEAKSANIIWTSMILIDIAIILTVPILIPVICLFCILLVPVVCGCAIIICASAIIASIICGPCYVFIINIYDCNKEIKMTTVDYKVDMPELEKQITLQNKKDACYLPVRVVDGNTQQKDPYDYFLPMRFKWISGLYLLRVIWRVLDVSGIIFIRTLCWLVIGGTTLTIIIGIEAIGFVFISLKTKQWDLLFGIVALIAVNDSFPMYIFMYRTLSNLILIILITIWMTLDFECPRCTEYNVRHSFVEDTTIFTIFIYCWIVVVFVPCITAYFITRHKNIFEKNTSLSRELNKMILGKNYDGILELQLYNEQCEVYDKQTQKTLLMLAFKEKRVAIVSYLLENTNVWDQIDDQAKNILDYYQQKASNIQESDKHRSMAKSLATIHKKYPNLVDQRNNNIFMIGCMHQEPNIVEEFFNFRDLLFSTNGNGENVLDYYVGTKIQISTETLLNLFIKYPLLVDKMGRNVFLCAAFVKDDKTLMQFKHNFENIDQSTDTNGNTVYDYFFQKPEQKSEFMTSLDIIQFYEQYSEYLTKNGNSPFFYACRNGDKQIVEQLITTYPDLTKTKDFDGYNILDYYLFNESLLSNNCLIYLCSKNKNIKTKQQQLTIFLVLCYNGNLECA